MRDLFIRGDRYRRLRRFAAVLLFALTVAPLGGRPLAADELKKSGTVEIEQTQIAFIGSGNLGGGKLYFGGKTYSFSIGGLGIGGFGISTMTAVGNHMISPEERFKVAMARP
jgi:hypothetical protein